MVYQLMDALFMKGQLRRLQQVVCLSLIHIIVLSTSGYVSRRCQYVESSLYSLSLYLLSLIKGSCAMGGVEIIFLVNNVFMDPIVNSHTWRGGYSDFKIGLDEIIQCGIMCRAWCGNWHWNSLSMLSLICC